MVDLTFGLGMLTAQRDPRDPRSDAEVYADLLDLCEHAEAEGFDAVWLTEHHFVDDGYLPSLLPMAAAIAARTRRVRVATGVLVAPLHDPVRIAEDAAVVDLVSGGRLLLGLGAGYREEEFHGFGRAKERLGAALDHTLDVLAGAWGPGVVQLAEDRPAVQVTPKPARLGGPPVWLGARTPAGIRRAGRRADGLLAARVLPAELAEQVGAFLRAAVDAGRDPATLEVGVHVPVLAWPDDAWGVVEPHLHYVEWKYQDMVGTPYGERTGPPAVPPAPTDRTREKLRAQALVGTPRQVADGVAAYVEAVAGVVGEVVGGAPVRFHFIPRLYWPGLPASAQREAVEVFAREVVPLLR